MQLPELSGASLELDGGIGTLTLRRDDVRNALTGTGLVDDIVRTAEWANGCPDIAVLVLTGEGRAFCSGGNLKEMRQRQGIFGGTPLDIQDSYRRGIQRIPLALQRIEIPVIAAVNGPAIGAGFDLACMCDLRIGSTEASFAESFLNLGIIPGDGGAWFLQRLVGYQRAAELALTGRRIDAGGALAIGLLLEVVEPSALLPRAMELAARIASQPPRALRLTKRLLGAARRMELPEFLDLCASFQGMAHHTDDHEEAVTALLEKRPGRYAGR